MRSTVLIIFLIILSSLFSLQETFNMYFLGDDFGFVYKIQKNFSFAWPQHQLTSMYRPLYFMFGTNPAGYFTFGFISFVISAITFYFLAKSVFSNKLYALIASLIYTTAPIGVESVMMMLVYLGSYFAIALFNVILLFLFKYLKTGKTLYYILSIVILLIAFETVAFRAFLFPIIMFVFGIFFWNRKKITLKKISISYAVLTGLWFFFFTFRAYLTNNVNSTYVTNLNPAYVAERFALYINNFSVYFMGSGYYQGLDAYVTGAIFEDPIRVIYPLLGTLNVIFTIPFGKIIPWLHIPLSILIVMFSIFIILKKKTVKNENLMIFFASIAFIFGEILAFFIPNARNIMPARDHYATYALPGYALLITSVFIILTKLLNKQKFVVFKIIPYLLLVIIISVNLYDVRNYLGTYNKRIRYVRPFFKQIKELLPTLPQNPVVYIQTTVNPDDDPAEARWRLYDIWHGGIHGPNVLFGLYYDIDASKTIATPTWDVVVEAVKENPDRINRVYSFDYDLDGLHPSTEKTRKTLQSLLQTKNP